MYYFRYFDENHLFIDIDGKIFNQNIEGKIRIQFSQKDILSIFMLDFEGNSLPVKKSSQLRKDIFLALEAQEWNKFLIEFEPIEGIANEDGQIISPLIALYPHKIIAKKIDVYAYLYPLLYNYNLPIFIAEEVIRKQKIGEDTHIYYRKDNVIYHIGINDFDFSIFLIERFTKEII